jgi:TIR domain
MQRALSFLALLILIAFFAACGSEGTSNNSNTTSTNTSNTNVSYPTPTPTPKKTDKITVTYPNLFLQYDNSDRGEVTFELEEVFEEVLSSTSTNGNTTRRIDKTDVAIRPESDSDKYDVNVEVQFIPTGLTTTDPLIQKQPYKQKAVWKWRLKPVEGMTVGENVSFRFLVHVTWNDKASGHLVKDIPDAWKNNFDDFHAQVGQPAWKVDMAFYGSPFMGFGGVVVSVKGVRRRKKSSGAESEEDDGEDTPETVSTEAELEEEVSSTVYAPGQAGQGDSFLVQVFVHLPEQAAALEEIAKEADEDAKQRITNKLQKKIKRGTELTFHLLMPGLDIDDPIQSCVWQGEPAWVQFGITVPEDCKPKSIIGTVTVSEASIPIGHLKFKFKITGDAASGGEASGRELIPAGNMVRYQQAFISYASKDRPEVLKRVQMLNLAKIKFFQDLLTLEAGDPWEKLLYDYIDKSDVFFLFWSKAASESEWVRKEIEYAIKRKTGENESGPEIIPVIIEGPPAAKPPTELSFLHFNDKLMYFINTRETEAKPLDG